jgi:hypothetical protein
MAHPSRLLFLVLPAALALPVFPAQALSVTAVSVEVTPVHSNGPCPVEFKFRAKIALNGAGRATYKWIRSDGGIDTLTHPPVVFAAAGTQIVETTWTLGGPDPAFHPFHGWMKIHVLTPNDKLSGPAEFKLDCSPNNPPVSHCDGKPDLIPVLHSPMDGWVQAKNVGTGNAGPSRLLIKCVKEGHTGPGGGCVDLPASAIAPPFFSTPDALGLSVPAIPCGGEFHATMPWWPNLNWPKGTYRFTATADVGNTVAESNEGNNVTTSSMTR